MKKFLLGSAALLALVSQASAADLAARPYTKAPPMMAAIYDWSGFYIGANGGYGSQTNRFQDVAAGTGVLTNLGRHDADGATAGGQIGYRWQAGQWVFGLEAQGNWADFRGNNINTVVAAQTLRSRLDAFGLFTGQVGYAWNNTLLYAKGGAAVTDNRYRVNSTATNALIASGGDQTRWGATAGAGIEFGFTPNWSFGVEYNHLFSERRDVAITTPAGAAFGTARVSGDADIVTARINYRWGGPVVARY